MIKLKTIEGQNDLVVKLKRLRKGIDIMTNYQEFKEQMLSNPEVKAEYEALESEFDNVPTAIEEKAPK